MPAARANPWRRLRNLLAAARGWFRVTHLTDEALPKILPQVSRFWTRRPKLLSCMKLSLQNLSFRSESEQLHIIIPGPAAHALNAAAAVVCIG